MVAMPRLELKLMSSATSVTLACSMAARRVQALRAVLQTPSDRSASLSSPVESTTITLPARARDVGVRAVPMAARIILTASRCALRLALGIHHRKLFPKVLRYIGFLSFLNS